MFASTRQDFQYVYYYQTRSPVCLLEPDKISNMFASTRQDLQYVF